MSRLVPLRREDLDPDDRVFYDQIQAEREQDPSDRRLVVPDVYRIMLYSPELASRVASTPMAIRAGTAVAQDVQEIVVLTVSREAMAATQWGVHVLRARDVGVGDDVIRAVNGHDLSPIGDRERLLVSFAARIYHQRMDDVTYAQVGAMLGERALVELTVLVGFTTMMIQIVKAFGTQDTVDVDIPLSQVTEGRASPSPWFA
jgi:4-carboxymuconolactone decarboxylase